MVRAEEDPSAGFGHTLLSGHALGMKIDVERMLMDKCRGTWRLEVDERGIGGFGRA